MNLLPYQQALVDDTNHFKVVVHDRCVGATVAAVHRAVKLEVYKPQRTYYLTFAVDEVVRLFLEQQMQATVTGDGNSQKAREITFGSGGQIIVLQHNNLSHYGLKFPFRLVIDSAAYASNFAALYTAALNCSDLLLVSDWGDEAAGKPNLFNLAVKRLYDMPDRQQQGVSLHVIDMEKALQDGLYRSMCEQNGQPWSPETEEKWINRRNLVMDSTEYRSVLTRLEEHRQTLQQETDLAARAPGET